MKESDGHIWSKTNLVTIFKGGKNYDEYKCDLCGVKAKRFGISWPPVLDVRMAKTRATCPGENK